MNEDLKHPYQLRRIELRDFKSAGEAAIDLRPLTVVVGANSSGKSTLLQSILAVTQAVRSQTSGAEFPLNGEFVRLAEQTGTSAPFNSKVVELIHEIEHTKKFYSPEELIRIFRGTGN